ncbi:aroma-sacti cluster domain-containing protein [Actinoplanes sp. NPDC020271]|uniref:aroma-sacti cluster domain-containing protein n=1 Tax=Actinoplanes sp. NPDC020271 TaxID=3363896 RepID=UPI0037A40C8A
MNDPLAQLRDAGCPIDQLSSAQRAVLAGLSEAEAAVLVSVYRRLADAEGEVVAHDLKML